MPESTPPTTPKPEWNTIKGDSKGCQSSTEGPEQYASHSIWEVYTKKKPQFLQFGGSMAGKNLHFDEIAPTHQQKEKVVEGKETSWCLFTTMLGNS